LVPLLGGLGGQGKVEGFAIVHGRVGDDDVLHRLAEVLRRLIRRFGGGRGAAFISVHRQLVILAVAGGLRQHTPGDQRRQVRLGQQACAHALNGFFVFGSALGLEVASFAQVSAEGADHGRLRRGGR
jgi:hypothetical protein